MLGRRVRHDIQSIQRPVGQIGQIGQIVQVDSGEVERRITSYVPEVSTEVLNRIGFHYLGTLSGAVAKWATDTKNRLSLFINEVDGATGGSIGAELTSRKERWERLIYSVDDVLTRKKGEGCRSDTFRDQSFDDVLKKAGKVQNALIAEINKVIDVIPEGSKEHCQGLIQQTTGQVQQIYSTMAGSVPDAAVRRKAAVMLGKWFSSSRLNHIAPIQEELLDYIAANPDTAVVFYLAVGKFGQEASARNMPDLSDLIFFGRIAAAGFSRITVLDEVPAISLIETRSAKPPDSSGYIGELKRIFEGITEIVIDQDAIYDRIAFDECARMAKQAMPRLGKGPFEGGSLEKELSDNLRAISRYVGSIGEEAASQYAINATAFLRAKVKPGTETEQGVYYGDHIYMAVTAKEGRHTIGYISDTKPSHGVAFIHPYKNGTLMVSVVPESELTKVRHILEEGYDWYTIENEKGDFLAHAITKKGDEQLTPESIYKSIGTAMGWPGNKGQYCLGVLNSLLQMEDVDPETLGRVAEIIPLDTPSQSVLDSVADALKRRGVPPELIDVIRSN